MAEQKLTRRNFISTAAGSSFSYLLMPGLGTLLHGARALAKCETEPTGMQDAPAFIGVDLRGGASIAGNNVMVYDDGMQLLKDYAGLGLPSSLNPYNNESLIDTSLGLPMHANSGILRGIKMVADDTVLANVNGCVICTMTADDTSGNEIVAAPGVFAVGSKGLLVPLVGEVYSKTPFAVNAKPVSSDGVKSMLSPSSIWDKRAEKVLALINKLSTAQLEKFKQMGLSEQVKAMIECGYLKAGDIISGKDKESVRLDYTKDANVKLDTNAHDEAANVCYMVMQGLAGAGSLVLGGYDYHDSTATRGERMDEQAGRAIGTLLKVAAGLQRKLMIHVHTDGGVDAGSTTQNVGGVDKYIWTGDSGSRSAAFVLVYDPAGRPSLDFQQMGSYNATGSVNPSPTRHAKISRNERAQATAVVANWLAWQGKVKDLEKFMPADSLERSEIPDYLFMKK